MNCAACGEKKIEVLDTRSFRDPNFDFFYVERRRKCLSCGHPFKTIEVDIEVWNERTEDGGYTRIESQEEGH